MNYDLAAMIKRAGRTRAPVVVGRAIVPTKAQEQALRSIYMRVVRGWVSAWSSRIAPKYATALPAMRDSVSDTEQAANEASDALNRLVLVVAADLENWVVTVERWHRGQFATVFTPAGVRLDTLLGAGDVRSTLQATLGENVSLIKSLNDQMRNGVSGAVFRGLSERRPARDVAREIRKVADVGKRRAELIAADQLQKLTSRLDQERQEQAGLSKFRWRHSRKKYPRESHVERDGKVYEWKSKVGKEDPPGRAIRCGCKPGPIVEIEEGAAEALDPNPAPEPAPVASTPAPRSGFRSPVRKDVTAESIAVRSRRDVKDDLTGHLTKSGTDDRYSPTPEFHGSKAGDFGSAAISTAFSDQSASMIKALWPELDDLADQLGIPRLRGMKTENGKAVARMGDGVISVNPTFFNRFAGDVGGAGDVHAAEIVAKREALAVEILPLTNRLRTLRKQMDDVFYGSSRWQELNDEAEPLRQKLSRLRDKDDKLWQQQGATRGMEPKATKWKPGDSSLDKPYGVLEYVDNGVDQARAILFHEFGHHVHQMYDRKGPRRQFGKPPVELKTAGEYRRALYEPNGVARILSKYGETNDQEWFAENFAAYALGRRDLLEPIADELITGLFNGTY